ncbi:MAG: BlaI/MecI/CopY family transcriptional regulator, partial [Oscillospiraceae bacterium]|nr:BlaI/MecI/CopY family transcriptional regulator [Oscillospiraceae bacterium]
MREEAGRILPSELEVMRILWERGEPMGQAELIRLLGEKRGLKEPTVKTFVRDLKLKGAIRLVSRGVYE